MENSSILDFTSPGSIPLESSEIVKQVNLEIRISIQTLENILVTDPMETTCWKLLGGLYLGANLTNKFNKLTQQYQNFFGKPLFPEFEEKNIEKAKVYKKLFPSKKYAENKLSKIMSELTKIIEEYIITRQSKSNELSNKIQLLRFYNERNLEKHYKQIEKEIEKLLENIPIGVLTQTLAYQYEEIRITHDLKSNDRDANYQKVYNILTAFTDAEKLRWHEPEPAGVPGRPHGAFDWPSPRRCPCRRRADTS